MSWLRSLFTTQAQVAAVTHERDQANAECFELKTQLKASEARLFREIESNRRREDVYKSEILELAGAQRRLPFREPLVEGDVESIAPVPGLGDRAADDPDFEAKVDHVAQGFIESAAARGTPYDTMGIKVLKAEIRASSGEYFA